MQVELVSPEGITYSGDASMVVVRTVGGGDIAFQSRHAPFIGVLQIREAKIFSDDGTEIFAVHSGFVQSHNDRVSILSDVSESKAEIDTARAQAALERADAALREDADDEAAIAAKDRAQADAMTAELSKMRRHIAEMTDQNAKLKLTIEEMQNQLKTSSAQR